MSLNYLVLSTFEGGYQPITALAAATALKNAGHKVSLRDIYVDGLDEEKFREYNVFVISVPLFDSLNAGIQLAEKIRAIDPSKAIVFFGQYATINAARLTPDHCDFCIKGEWEQPLVALAAFLEGEPVELHEGVVSRAVSDAGIPAKPFMSRNHLQLLDRGLAPNIKKYPQPHLEKLLGHIPVVGGLEITRGCHHKCTYCSVFAAYDGKVIVGKEEIVLDDVDQLIDQGMTHLTFMDAEFFNAQRRSMKILKEIHERHPALTYDFTTRVDHLLESRDLLPEMYELGVRVITSALEFPKQRVLDVVAKETTVAEIDMAISAVRNAGITLNPTFIMYNPWVSKQDIHDFSDFVDRNSLDDAIDPIQYETRLHLYKGSPLMVEPSIQELDLEEHEFHYSWKHWDPEVDALFLANVTPVEEGTFKRCCLKC